MTTTEESVADTAESVTKEVSHSALSNKDATQHDKNQHHHKETPWIDAWIRWERDSKDTINSSDDDDDEEEQQYDTPTKSFSFTYYHLPTDATI